MVAEHPKTVISEKQMTMITTSKIASRGIYSENDSESGVSRSSSKRIRANQEIPTEALILRGQFPQIVIHANFDENNWQCDICLSMETQGEDDDDLLSICELCQVVVHPGCYRRDLFD